MKSNISGVRYKSRKGRFVDRNPSKTLVVGSMKVRYCSLVLMATWSRVFISIIHRRLGVSFHSEAAFYIPPEKRYNTISFNWVRERESASTGYKWVLPHTRARTQKWRLERVILQGLAVSPGCSSGRIVLPDSVSLVCLSFPRCHRIGFFPTSTYAPFTPISS